MSLDVEEVLHIAQLARINLCEEELRKYQGQLQEILTFVDQLQAPDTQGVEPLYHPVGLNAPWREDKVTQTNDRENLQRCAPHVENGLFLVPKVKS